MADSQEQAGEALPERNITLEEVRLAIGEVIYLQAQSGDAIERYSVRLIGMSKSRSVIVTTPMVDG